MLNRLIHWSLANRALVMGIAVLVLLAGLRAARELPVEVLPDLTRPTVTVLTEAPGFSPEEAEARITRPIESALLGVSGLTRLRSKTDVALSLVFAEFEWGADIYDARMLVQERLQSVRGELPEGIEPVLTPVASLMGEILLIGVRSTSDEVTPRDVRSIADWTIRPRLQTIPGIAEILNMGGGVARLEVQPDPWRMEAHGISLEDLRRAAAGAAGTTAGGFLDSGSTEIMVRNLSMTLQPEEIAATVIRTVNGHPVRIRDVARVEWGVEPMRGDAAIGVRHPGPVSTPGVVMSVTKSPGTDTRRLTARIEAALADLEPSLPAAVETVVLFRQSDFIDRAIGNLEEAIRDGAIMVSLVIFAFLLNVRTTAITLMAIPLSFAVTLVTFRWFGLSVNSMTLGGLAVAIGMVVDDAIIDVENVYRRLRENAASPNPRPRLEVIASASAEVRNSILYATLLLILVFLPLLSLSGVEGRLFAPIAVGTIVSMVASFLVSLAAIPVLCSFLLRPRTGEVHRDGPLVRGMKWILEHVWLRIGLNHPVLLIAAAGALLVAGGWMYAGMGKDFLPAFREETLLISTTAAPGTSLEHMREVSGAIEEQLLAVEGVRTVGRRIGRAERGDHVVPVSIAEFDVDFDPESERPREAVLDEIRTRIRTVPGTFSVLTGPLADRIGHMLSGVAAPVAVKIFGPDPDMLRQLGTRIQEVAKSIPGLENARLDQLSSIPELRTEVDRERAAAYGVLPNGLNRQLASLIGGEHLAELQDGLRSVSLVLRLPPEWRDSAERIRQLPVESLSGQRVLLSQVADVREARGPANISREGGSRCLVVAIQPDARDAGGLVERLREAVHERVPVPEGYSISFEGGFQARLDASRRILLLSAAIFVVIAFLLYGYFRSALFAAQVICDIPLAFIGGIFLTKWMPDNISIATMVGFIAVAGVAARNSIMLISHYLHLMAHEGGTFSRAMVIRGTKERLVPVLMTALAAGTGLIPLLLAAGEPGKEILHPIAVVIAGGLVTTTLLGLGVTPTVFYHLGRRAAARSLELRSAASR